jgi:hypothetical protein
MMLSFARGRSDGPLAPVQTLLRSAVVALAAATGAAAPSVVLGQSPQIQPVEPYGIVITSDNVPLKGGAGLVYYAVAMLKSGQVLKVDGQAPGGWLRVEYPKGLRAFIKADDAVLEEGGKTIRLTRPSNLMAVNMAGGERGHWWTLVDEPRPAGAKFPVVETLKTPDGKAYGYLVPAPPEARGYVKSESTRKATAQELAAYEQSLGAAPAPAGAETAKPKVAAAPAPTPAPTGGTPANPPAADPGTAPAGGGVIRTIAPAAGDAAPSQPAGAAPAPAADGAAPAADTAAPAAKPAERRVGTVESLQSLFEQVQGGKDAELPSVIAEFERSIRALGQTDEERRTAEFLKARLEVLRLRQAVQASRLAAEEAARGLDQQQSHLQEQVRNLERARNYAMVGRLVPSTVYDGKRLPKMYRIQSLEPGFARTIGYLSPAANDELDSRLGRIVGVVGDARFDESLRLNIVTPKRVDVLSPSEIPGAAPTTEPKPVADVPTQGVDK